MQCVLCGNGNGFLRFPTEGNRKNKKSAVKGQKVVDKRRKVSIISKVSRGERGAERRNV